MAGIGQEKISRISGLKRSGKLHLLLVLFGVSLALIFGEIALRVLPIPGIVATKTYFDPALGYRRFAGEKNVYISADGRKVVRLSNSNGYFDREHAAEKGNFFRIGLFGDSFVESLQVELDETYYALVQDRLRDKRVECIAIGRAGYSALHAYLECRRWMKHYDLDLVVYVFYENDMGDQVKGTKRHFYLPYAELTETGYAVHRPLRAEVRFPRLFRWIDAARNHSVLFRNAWARSEALFFRNDFSNPSDKDQIEEALLTLDKMPATGDRPSAWPLPRRQYAETLMARIVRDINALVAGNGRRFAVFYIPEAREFRKPTDEQDSWKKFLEDLCERENIPFIDPSRALVLHEKREGAVFGDHFTAAGHRAAAEALTEWLKGQDLWKARDNYGQR